MCKHVLDKIAPLVQDFTGSIWLSPVQSLLDEPTKIPLNDHSDLGIEIMHQLVTI